MDGGGAAGGRRRSFKQRLGLFNGLSCCGTAWGISPSTIIETEDEIPNSAENRNENVSQPPHEADITTECAPDITAANSEAPLESMNLAAALAAEREFRAAETAGQEGNDLVGELLTPGRVSLMRLLAEPVGGEGEPPSAVVEIGEGEGEGSGVVCCVCMVRKKGAAFIPCGHTYCRVCSRELWVNRGTCPLCNRPIAEILDIF
ncbi:unnamed protein product [Rhodiola kirilowii]